MRILVVDDELVSRAKLRSILTRYGACDTAADGDEALVLLEKAWAAGQPYDLVTLDVEMPGLGGEEIVSRIRLHEETAGLASRSARVLMVSVHDGREVWSSFRRGCDGYLVKPVSPESVHTSLVQLGITHG